MRPDTDEKNQQTPSTPLPNFNLSLNGGSLNRRGRKSATPQFAEGLSKSGNFDSSSSSGRFVEQGKKNEGSEVRDENNNDSFKSPSANHSPRTPEVNKVDEKKLTPPVLKKLTPPALEENTTKKDTPRSSFSDDLSSPHTAILPSAEKKTTSPTSGDASGVKSPGHDGMNMIEAQTKYPDSFQTNSKGERVIKYPRNSSSPPIVNPLPKEQGQKLPNGQQPSNFFPNEHGRTAFISKKVPGKGGGGMEILPLLPPLNSQESKRSYLLPIFLIFSIFLGVLFIFVLFFSLKKKKRPLSMRKIHR